MKGDRAPKRPRLTGARIAVWAGGLTLLLIAIGLACSLVGHSTLSWEPTWRIWEWELWTSQIWKVRAFRLLAAVVVGAALGTAGLATQGLLRNPLAEPYLLGISSGAGVGVLLGISASRWIAIPEWCTQPVLATFGALVTSVIVYGISQRRGRIDPLVLLLAGAILNVFNGALILVIQQLVQKEQVLQFVGWGMGQIPEWLWFRPMLLCLSGGAVLAGWAWIFARAAALNALGLGDEVAASSGVPVHRLRLEVFLVVSLMTSAAVALAGPIGFVGLMVPHIARLVAGPDHRTLAVVCALGGAVFLMIADTLSKRLGECMAMGELPVGVVTALTGGPFFIWLLRRKLRGEGP